MKQTFDFATEPHEAEVGPVTILFRGEVDVREMLAVQSRLFAAYGDPEAEPDLRDTERTGRVIEGMRSFLAELMLPESVEVFADAVVPERTLMQLYQWIQGVYSGRPTTPSSGSQDSPSSNGADSTEPLLLTEQPTPSTGGTAGSSTPSKSTPSARRKMIKTVPA